MREAERIADETWRAMATVYVTLRGVARHDPYQDSQIALLKKMQRSRPRQ